MSSLTNLLRNRLCCNSLRRPGYLSLVNTNNVSNKSRNYFVLQNNNVEDKTKTLALPMVTPMRLAGSFHMPYTMSHIEERILLVLKLYDKVNPDTLTLNSHFYEDLGLDSLDHVEVIIAIEDEFDFEIPEEHSYRFMRPKDFVRYVADRFDIYE